MRSKRACWVACISLAGAALAQDADDASQADDDEAAPTSVEKCFLAPAILDLVPIDDSHVYVQTQGGNHYLLTVGQCDNLERSYLRGTVRLVNYGRRVCQNDGSYLLYDGVGREATCPIVTIDRVSNRAEARSMADPATRDVVNVEAIELPD